MLDKNNYQGNGAKKPYIFFDEATKRKVRRHIFDINDVITEKDIKNAKVPGLDEGVPTNANKKKPNKSENKKVDDTPGNPVTPWDVIDE